MLRDAKEMSHHRWVAALHAGLGTRAFMFGIDFKLRFKISKGYAA